MKVFHQTGHNYKWNIESFVNDQAGNGLIISPVNIENKKVRSIDLTIRKKSFLDPQLYLPKDLKGKLSTYEFFPAKIKNVFETSDFEKIALDIAQRCIDFQFENQFQYIIIPTRHYEHITSKYYQQLYKCFVDPFVTYYEKIKHKMPLLLTVIVKESQLIDDEQRFDLLNWITSIQNIHGVYLIFENNFTTKQIRNAIYLAKSLEFIDSLKKNDLQVHVGYTNVEGLLYSIANPDSIAFGAYENLRSFNIKRFAVSGKRVQTQPNPRLYSGKLLQWIDYGYMGAINSLYSNLNNIFEDSKYKPLMFTPRYNWHFNKPELYKHFFIIYSNQVKNLPESIDIRFEHVRNLVQDAISIFKEIEKVGVVLDENSNDSHLTIWLTAINLFKKYKEDNKDAVSK